MPDFDWLDFLQSRGIEYREAGPREVEIHCVFCGDQDASSHLSINLKGHGWKCWRQPREHSGRSPIRLIQALLGCPWEQARDIADGGTTIGSDFLNSVRSKLGPPVTPLPRPELKLPDEFKAFTDLPSSTPFVQYLRGRGFTLQHIPLLSKRFKLRYSTWGPFKGRIIFPIHFEKQLRTWTGRTIYRQESLRYLTLGTDQGDPITDYLLWWDQIRDRDCDTIYLCEGPFDAAKITVLGFDYGICATCFFTATATTRQIDLLHELLPRFKYRYVLLDRDTLPTALRLMQTLSGLGVKVRHLPPGYKDPGELTTTSANFLLPSD